MAALDAQSIDSVHGQSADNKPKASSAFCCKAEDVKRTQVTSRNTETKALTPRVSGSRGWAGRCADLCTSYKDSCHGLVKLS